MSRFALWLFIKSAFWYCFYMRLSCPYISPIKRLSAFRMPFDKVNWSWLSTRILEEEFYLADK